MARKIPTQQDVAREAGVSRTTVSYVLNQNASANIPQETQQRVWEAVEKLQYVPNRTARNLRAQKTFTIASIIQDITNPFHPELERGIQDVAEKHGYDLIMYSTDGLEARERRALSSAQERVDGVIGSFFHLQEADFYPLLERDIPVVWLHGGRCSEMQSHVDMLLVDNRGAAQEAVEYLLKTGHTKIAILSGEGPPGKERLHGYIDQLERARIPLHHDYIYPSQMTVEDGIRGTQLLLAKSPRPTAIFAVSDMLAIGAQIATKSRGLRIPDDIAIVGFDDIFPSALVTPSLTTISLPQRKLGQRAAEMLFQRLHEGFNDQGYCEEMPYKLIVRESA